MTQPLWSVQATIQVRANTQAEAITRATILTHVCKTCGEMGQHELLRDRELVSVHRSAIQLEGE